jgi:hypothetical protein
VKSGISLCTEISASLSVAFIPLHTSYLLPSISCGCVRLQRVSAPSPPYTPRTSTLEGCLCRKHYHHYSSLAAEACAITLRASSDSRVLEVVPLVMDDMFSRGRLVQHGTVLVTSKFRHGRGRGDCAGDHFVDGSQSHGVRQGRVVGKHACRAAVVSIYMTGSG